MKKSFVLFLIAGAAALASLTIINSAGATELRYCNTSPIIQCGALTAEEFTQKYNKNEPKDLPAIFAHYNINPSAISSAKEGTINKNGEIRVDGKVVATGAWSVGREKLGSINRAVSINKKTYYEKPASAALTVQEEPAFVFLDSDGKYTGAIIKSCGNPLLATAVPVKKPEEKPKPQPEATCKLLSATITNRDHYKLSAKATVEDGATISAHQYVITNDDNNSVVVDRTVTTTSTTSSIEGTLPAGEYSARVTIKTSVGDRTADDCTAQLTIEEEEVPVTPEEPETPEVPEEEEKEVPVTPAELPETGAGDAALGLLGLGSVIASSGYYYASRRGILSAWLNR